MDYISDIQKEKIMNALTEKRRIHTRGVRETGKKLSKIYGADAEKVDIACVFHDLYRGKNILELDKLVDEFAIDVKYKGNANLSHGKIAAKAAERDFGIKDREILDAISRCQRCGIDKPRPLYRRCNKAKSYDLHKSYRLYLIYLKYAIRSQYNYCPK